MQQFLVVYFHICITWRWPISAETCCKTVSHIHNTHPLLWSTVSFTLLLCYIYYYRHNHNGMNQIKVTDFPWRVSTVYLREFRTIRESQFRGQHFAYFCTCDLKTAICTEVVATGKKRGNRRSAVAAEKTNKIHSFFKFYAVKSGRNLPTFQRGYTTTEVCSLETSLSFH